MSQANKGYVSGIDQFLASFDKAHPALSQSQKREKVKYERVYDLRDHAKPGKKLNNFFVEIDF